ncbi:CoA transferase [Saccharopolyspora sp. HNM0983]|uniref:CoA transferase n=1 Tax=Saccharopolyspora montiporae TaxID=2781240 RepID=A0A929FYU3_9PSEU|nr:CoA transferase [Saccharopolyspora sp. HNM0983]
MTGIAAPQQAAVSAEVAGQLLRLAGCHPPEVEVQVDRAGPLRVDPTEETAVQAACGIMHVHGRAAGHPVPLGVDYASATAGVLAAQGAVAAAFARARGAQISAVRTSAVQAALLSVQQYVAVAAAGGIEPAAAPTGRRPPFTSRDGVRFEVETLDAEVWQRFWQFLGAAHPEISGGWWPFQQRFATARCDLPVRLHEVTADADYAGVRAAAERSGMSVLAVRAEPEAPAELPAFALTPLGGGSPGVPQATGPLPLEGVTVVESTRRVQGPLVGHVLRLLGADVLRAEPPGGDPLRGVPPLVGDCSARYLALNRGKRVVELDIKSARGRDELRGLLSGADVFVHNWAPGKAAELGLDAGTLVRDRPGLCYAEASGWGTALGPRPPVGTDFLVQAHSGLAAALRPGRAEPSLMTLTDVLGGLVCAQGVLAGLLHRVRTGRGCRVASSLLSASGVLPRGHSPRQVLRAADGYVAVSGPASGAFSDVLRTGSADASTASWVQRFAAAGLAATTVQEDLRALAADPAAQEPARPWEFR